MMRPGVKYSKLKGNAEPKYIVSRYNYTKRKCIVQYTDLQATDFYGFLISGFNFGEIVKTKNKEVVCGKKIQFRRNC